MYQQPGCLLQNVAKCFSYRLYICSLTVHTYLEVFYRPYYKTCCVTLVILGLLAGLGTRFVCWIGRWFMWKWCHRWFIFCDSGFCLLHCWFACFMDDMSEFFSNYFGWIFSLVFFLLRVRYFLLVLASGGGSQPFTKQKASMTVGTRTQMLCA